MNEVHEPGVLLIEDTSNSDLPLVRKKQQAEKVNRLSKPRVQTEIIQRPTFGSQFSASNLTKGDDKSH